MVEEEKKMGEEGKKMEEKKPEEKKTEVVKEKTEEVKEKKEVKSDEGKKEEKKSDEEKTKEEEAAPSPPTPPPPPQEIVLRVFMHCEGCAKKVRKCLKNFSGVEQVMTDCKSSKVVVKGEKADPLKVLERVQRKSHRRVELISPIPKLPTEEEIKKAQEEQEKPKPEEKKEEPQVITVILKVHMHCEACAEEIQKRIIRMKGVESAAPDLKISQVTVKGIFDPLKLVDYVYKRTGKHAKIVPAEPEKKEDQGEDNKGKVENDEKKTTEDGDKENKDAAEERDEKKDGAGAAGDVGEEKEKEESEEEILKVVEMNRNEYYYYPPKYSTEYYYNYPPQMFSDENPNACSVM